MAAMAIPAALKALMASKYFWPALISGGFLGQTALGEVGKAGERGIAREELRLQKIIGESKIAGTEKAVKESRERAKEYTKMLLGAKKEERKTARESMLMETFMASQDKQAALVMQAIQSLAQNQPRYSASPSGGMVGLMRSNI